MLGPVFVAAAAILWATDALVRYPLVQAGIDPIFVVFFDHLLGVLLLTPFVIYRYGRALVKISAPQWTGLILIGGGASALATVLFTTSFRYVNPSVSILLQKLQPIFVVWLAMVFLRERPQKSFWIWSPVALLAGLTISFPTFDFEFLSAVSVESQGSFYALGAAALWGLATVVGKGVVSKLHPMIVTYWRFVFGWLTLGLMLAVAGSFHGNEGGALTLLAQFRNPEILPSLLYLALVPGMLALILYYQGMVRTTASTTTFMELLFPVAAVAINTVFLGTELSAIQAAAALVLLFAITQLSLVHRRKTSTSDA